MRPGRLKIQFDLQAGTNLGEITTKIGILPAGFQLGLPAIFNLIHILIDGIQGAKFFEQGNGRLFTHARHAGDVIGFIADEGFVIHHLIGTNAQFTNDILIGDVVLVIAGEVDGGAFIDQLQEVAVAGDDLNAQTLGRHRTRHRAKHIIGFIAFHLKARDVEGVHQLADTFDLRTQVFGHLGARGFIFGEELVAKGLAGIEGDGQVFGFFLLEDAHQLARKAIDARSRFPLGGLPALGARTGSQRKIHAIGEGVTINEIEGGGHKKAISG